MTTYPTCGECRRHIEEYRQAVLERESMRRERDDLRAEVERLSRERDELRAAIKDAIPMAEILLQHGPQRGTDVARYWLAEHGGKGGDDA